MKMQFKDTFGTYHYSGISTEVDSGEKRLHFIGSNEFTVNKEKAKELIKILEYFVETGELIP